MSGSSSAAAPAPEDLVLAMMPARDAMGSGSEEAAMFQSYDLCGAREGDWLDDPRVGERALPCERARRLARVTPHNPCPLG